MTGDWLQHHRAGVETRGRYGAPLHSSTKGQVIETLLSDRGFNNHSRNDGTHVSPYDDGTIKWGTDGLQVRILQGVDEAQLKRVLSRTLRATTGISPTEVTDEDADAVEMFSGGLQSALESQVVIFEITGASRALTHQLVRTRKAAYHQQSQRATWFGDRPSTRFPESIRQNRNPDVERAWIKALLACWDAYKVACDSGISYQDARYILPEGTTNYIICEYPLREFLNVYAYRACSGFLWEMVSAMRSMGQVLIDAHPFLTDYVKISCEKGSGCEDCGGNGKINLGDAHPKALIGLQQDEDLVVECQICWGTGGRKCHFQGWENVEEFCDKPQAKQGNRIFLPNPKYRIGG